MTARLLVLPGLLAALFAGTITTARDEKSTAPAPRPAGKAKTPQQLLIGTWKRLSTDGRAVRKDTLSTMEFTKDGQAIYRYFSPRRAPRDPAVGKYRLERNTLVFSLPGTPTPPANPAVEYRGTIETLTEDKLILRGNSKELNAEVPDPRVPKPVRKPVRSVFERMRGK
jgi:hypothetical protein